MNAQLIFYLWRLTLVNEPYPFVDERCTLLDEFLSMWMNFIHDQWAMWWWMKKILIYILMSYVGVSYRMPFVTYSLNPWPKKWFSSTIYGKLQHDFWIQFFFKYFRTSFDHIISSPLGHNDKTYVWLFSLNWFYNWFYHDKSLNYVFTIHVMSPLSINDIHIWKTLFSWLYYSMVMCAL